MASVVNVGAGAGSYEPAATVVAVEPSTIMIEQRPPGAAPCVRGLAEALPLRDESVDAALAVLTIHHWSDVEAGIAELRRVARRRIAIVTWADLDSGRWHQHHLGLSNLDRLDAGYRLVGSDLPRRS